MKLKSLSKKGQIGLDLAQRVILVFVVIIILAIVGIVITVNLRDANILTDGSLEANQTTDIIGNYSTGVTTFFSNTTTIFTILFIVVLVSLFAIVLLVIRRFGGGGGGL